MNRNRFSYFAYFIFLTGLATNLDAQIPDEVQRLKRENSKLKSELARKSKLLEKAILAGFVNDEKPIQSALEIVTTLPKNLALNAKKPWDQVQKDEAIKFLKRQSIGKYFKTKLTLESLTLRENPDHVKDRSKPKYIANVKFRRRALPKNGFVVWQDILPLGQSLVFYGDDELAEQAKKMRRGKKYLVEGLIRGIEFRYNATDSMMIRKENQHLFRLELSRLKLPALK